MTNDQTTNVNHTIPEETNDKVSWGVVGVIIFIVFALLTWFLISEPTQTYPIENSKSLVIDKKVQEPEHKSIAADIDNKAKQLDSNIDVSTASDKAITPVTPEAPKVILPLLNESDALVNSKLPSITWRQELLKLIITDDIIRRFVVFTDNFSRGSVAYEHSLLTRPKEPFSANQSIDNNTGKSTLLWNEKSSTRFNVYVDLLRSLNTDELISFYTHIKPLINEAYEELGYPDKNFTHALQLSITQVLDAEIPEVLPELSRTSVMYKYADENLEALSDAEKLLLRLGKENVLVIKSVLLDISEKLAKTAE